MALPKLFNLITWHNNTTPAINEDNLNAMSQAIDDIDDRVIGLAGTIMEDVPQIQEDLEILEPAIENIDSNVERAETAADDAEDSAETAEYWANVSNPPIPVVKDFASVITVDDAIPKAATDVKVKVEAVQDLHGYTKPWTVGAGKNKLPMTLASIKAANTGATWAGNVATLSGMTFTVLTDGDNNVTGVKITGQNSGGTVVFGLASHNFGNSTFNSFAISSTEYIATSGITGDSSTTYGIQYQADIQLTYIRIASGYNFGTGKTIQPMIRLATDTDSTFEPPTNICHISGFTEVKLERTAKNLWGYGIQGSGGFAASHLLLPEVIPTFTVSAKSNGNGQLNVCAYKPDGTKIGVDHALIESGNTSGSYTYTGVTTPCYIRIYVVSGSSSDYSEIQIEKGDQATDYEPFGTFYTITLGGTRYGATLDVDSGVMSVTHGFGTVNDISKLSTPQTSASGNWGTYSVSGVKRDNASAVVISDRAKAIAFNNRVDSGNIASDRVYSDDSDNTIVLRLSNSNTITAKQDFYNYWEGAELCYELATPITVQLTPTEVQMLQGYNVLSANSGDVYLKYDASMIQRIANEKLDISTFKSVVASSSDFADFKTKVAAL